MNLRGKKENINPSKVLAGKPNKIKTSNGKKTSDNQPKIIKILKETDDTKPKRARKAIVAKPSGKSKAPAPRASAGKENAPAKAPCCFGFSDSDLEEAIVPYNGELTEFDNSKPYRLALYVKPSNRIRIGPALIKQFQNLNPTLNLTNVSMMSSAGRGKQRLDSETTIMSPNRTQWKVPFSSTPKDPKKAPVKMVQRKITDILQPGPKRTRSGNAGHQFTSYFEDSSTTDEEKVTPPAKYPKMNPKPATPQESTSEETVPVPVRKPSRRSYVKKSRPQPEPEDETSSEEILKSIEKTKKRGKGKKADKADKEYEKWSRSMNSMFSEVEQFEISFD